MTIIEKQKLFRALKNTNNYDEAIFAMEMFSSITNESFDLYMNKFTPKSVISLLFFGRIIVQEVILEEFNKL